MKYLLTLAFMVAAGVAEHATASTDACSGWRDGWKTVSYAIPPRCPFPWTSKATYDQGFEAGQRAALRN